jgi:hypothetical protein
MLDVLTGRRPDIVETELTCDNTNTPLPYIDLVNEVLENQVAGSTETYQTDWDADILRVQPEHLNRGAYDKTNDDGTENENSLALASYPWLLPFDLWLAETRVYLGQLGVSRADLLEHFERPGGEPGADEIATERLGLTDHDRNLIVDETTEDEWELWGWDSSANWKVKLDTVSTFLEKSGLQYENLEDLLRTRYLNPDETVRVQFDSADCDLDEAQLLNRPGGFFNRTRRFVRLAQHLDWDYRQLDAALAALAPHELDGTFLNRLSTVVDIHERTDADVEEILSWFGGLDTHDWDDEPSFYARLFQDESVTTPAEEVFALQPDGRELADTGQSIEDHVDPIRAALGVTAEVLSLLIETQLDETDELTLENLSKLYRVVSLAEAVDASVDDLVVVQQLSDRTPFGPEAVDEMSAFLGEFDRVQQSDFSVAELDYLLRHTLRPGSQVATPDEVVSQRLTELRDGLRALEEEYRIVEGQPLSDQTVGALSVLLSETEVTRAIALLEQRSTESEADLDTFIESAFGSFLDATAARDELLSDTGISATEERYEYVLSPLLEFLLRTRREDYVVQELSDALDVDTSIVSTLLRSVLLSEADAAEFAIADYLDPDFLATADEPPEPEEPTPVLLEPEDAPAIFAQFRRLEKATRLLEGFGIPVGEIPWLIEHGPTFGTLDLETLPIEEESTEAATRFDGWLRLRLLEELRPIYGKNEDGIVGVLEAIRAEEPEETLHERLSGATGWSESDIGGFLGPDGLGVGLPDTSNLDDTLSALERLATAFDLLDRLGTSAETAADWAQSPPSFEQARSIRQSLRAQYGEERWLEVAEPLRDDLRDDQREALVAYLIENLSDDGITDTSDLYARFLLDTEMTSCMMTSRIKQAIASIQLFVQRAQMNLEDECLLSEDDEREWGWRKKYRVWEANRKVFLYPENWLQPELRRDKSPFFEDLEGELLQAEVTDENVERVYLNYLEKLDDVARLEIIACHLERDDESERFHVVGRTRDTPNRYFYRRFEDGSRWTAWEAVEIDIEGDHVIPVVFNRRLRIIWPVFVPKADDEGVAREDSSDASEPDKILEIQLAWSELRNGNWTPKRVTDAKLTVDGTYEPHDVSFGATVMSGRLSVVAFGAYGYWGTLGYFTFTGAGDQVLTEASDETLIPDWFWLVWNRQLQPDTEPWYNTLREDSNSDNDLELYAVPPSRNHTIVAGGYGIGYSGYDRERTPVLERTPGRFELVLPPQIPVYRSQAPLFYQDEDRTFFVRPYRTTRSYTAPSETWVKPDGVIPEVFEPIEELPREIPEEPPLCGGDSQPQPDPPPFPFHSREASR